MVETPGSASSESVVGVQLSVAIFFAKCARGGTKHAFTLVHASINWMDVRIDKLDGCMKPGLWP